MLIILFLKYTGPGTSETSTGHESEIWSTA